ncbi:U4/U6.U5 tri-snRNP-associated protein 2 [Acropora cervicornis]|uniref:ubiquitinyl hydrolase 1 n=1 Tax=Acropora cervicornis TaxID=6130 RepID=A0AAD9QRY2_ACRCE|nr:U4/U6.U5 tri-snRNP-associated protein 2 [Acropora cervicornis]
MADDSEVEIRGVKRPLVENYSDEEEEEEARIKEERSEYQSRHCPYLDTIDRHVLDFDFEKLCSVSLSHINVYACLVCGKYFQGKKALMMAPLFGENHRKIFQNSINFYCLPDNYEVIDSSLDDIKYVLNPTFAKDEILQLDKSAKVSRAFDGTMYLPGMVGLNNIKANDYLNVILQALAFIPPIRDFFLREENYQKIKRPPGDIMFHLAAGGAMPLVRDPVRYLIRHPIRHLIRHPIMHPVRDPVRDPDMEPDQVKLELVPMHFQKFQSLFEMKIWNPRNFKAHVSPHEMLQAVVLCSKKRFQFTEQGDPVEFLSWFLNSLHTTLGGTKKATSSELVNVIDYIEFSGVIYKTFQGKMRITSRKLPQTENDEELKKEVDKEEYKETTSSSPYMYLMLDIPPSPLYKDEYQQNIIPQEYKTYKETFVKKFELTKLPKYLIMCVKRFTKNMFFVEKNPTVVNFPVKGVDMAEYLVSDPAVQDAHPHTQYDLVLEILKFTFFIKYMSYKKSKSRHQE